MNSSKLSNKELELSTTMKNSNEISKDSSISRIIQHKSQDCDNANKCNNGSDEEINEETIEEYFIIDSESEDNAENNYQNKSKIVESSKSVNSKINAAINNNNNNSINKIQISKPVNKNCHFQKKNNDSKVFYVVDDQKNIIKVDLIHNTYEVVYIDKTKNKQKEKVSNQSLSSTPSIDCVKMPKPILPKTENVKNDLISILDKKAINNPQETLLNSAVSTEQSDKKNILTNFLNKKVNDHQTKFNTIASTQNINCVKTSSQKAILNTQNSQNLLGSKQTLLLIKPIVNHDKNITSNNKDSSNVNLNESLSVNPANYFTLNTQTNSLVPIYGFITTNPVVPPNQRKVERRIIPKPAILKTKENKFIVSNKKSVSLDLKTVNLSKLTCSQEQEPKENSKEKLCQSKQDSVPININTEVPIFRQSLLTEEQKEAKELIIDALGVKQKEIDDNKIIDASGSQINSTKKSITNEITLPKNQESLNSCKENFDKSKQNLDPNTLNRVIIIRNNEVSISQEISLTKEQQVLDEKNRQLILSKVMNQKEIIINNEAADISSIASSTQLALVKLSRTKDNNEDLVSSFSKRKISEISETVTTKKLKTSESDKPVYECCICKIQLRSIELLNEHYKNHPESKVFFSSKLMERHKMYCSSKKKFYKCKKCIKYSGYPF